MWRSWPFFRMACSTLEMALFKVDLSVGRRYLALVDDALAERFWPELEAEHGRVVARLLAIRDGEALLDGTPALRERWPANRHRAPLSHLQVALLARSRAGDSTVGAALMATITGIAGAGTRGRAGRTPWRRASDDTGQRYGDDPHQLGELRHEPDHHARPPVAAGHAFTLPSFGSCRPSRARARSTRPGETGSADRQAPAGRQPRGRAASVPLEPASVAHQRAVGSDHAVARNDDRQRVAAVREADRADELDVAEPQGERLVGDRLGERDPA